MKSNSSFSSGSSLDIVDKARQLGVTGHVVTICAFLLREPIKMPEKQRYGDFKMPLHYPRYTAADYESMPEWKLDALLSEYGLPATGSVHHKRKFAIGAFLWPH
nr:Protein DETOXIFICATION like [Ipomoea batatas]